MLSVLVHSSLVFHVEYVGGGGYLWDLLVLLVVHHSHVHYISLESIAFWWRSSVHLFLCHFALVLVLDRLVLVCTCSLFVEGSFLGHLYHLFVALRFLVLCFEVCSNFRFGIYCWNSVFLKMKFQNESFIIINFLYIQIFIFTKFTYKFE